MNKVDLTGGSDDDGGVAMDVTDDDGSDWACSVCTYNHAHAASTCAMCGSTTGAPARAPAAPPSPYDEFIAVTGAGPAVAKAFVDSAAARGFSVQQAIGYFYEKGGQLPRPRAPAPPQPPSWPLAREERQQQ